MTLLKEETLIFGNLNKYEATVNTELLFLTKEANDHSTRRKGTKNEIRNF